MYFEFSLPPGRAKETREDQEVEIEGLDLTNKEEREFKDWVQHTASMNAIIKGNRLVWEGKIPYGDFIMKNCNKLKWSVKKFGVKVTFEGLTIRSQTVVGTGRRRLLSRSYSSGC